MSLVFNVPDNVHCKKLCGAHEGSCLFERSLFLSLGRGGLRLRAEQALFLFVMEIQVVVIIWICCGFNTESPPDCAQHNLTGTLASICINTYPRVCHPHLWPHLPTRFLIAT